MAFMHTPSCSLYPTSALLIKGRAETVGDNLGFEGDHRAEGSHKNKRSNDDSHRSIIGLG